ncbi:hypothetical protein [Sphingobacterium paucimobilis]|uniref:ABC transporter substrate-binding protein n=1 Tax=Sphingobacterium paucimobilis HER1398 TaxID=1346330 RepID=U2JA86_9SPHI|nr:hypothetical protein [Sphingobacterium paucimobilis]ERJ59543.1 hypothetical protein M472_12250 [Sphingobacterium paucimobilis HER1398]
MTKYKEIIATLRRQDDALAEYWEEEIDTIIHKLKFLTADAIPSVCIVDQNNDFQSSYSPILQEKVKVAGGNLTNSLQDDIAIFIILQRDESLYGTMPDFLNRHAGSKAITNNHVYIVQTAQFDENENTYLQDVEILAEIIQPKYFIFGRNGSDWIKFDLN